MKVADAEIVDEASGVLLRRVVVGPLDTNCWLLADPNDRSALVVDPGDAAATIIDAADDLVVTGVVLTHCHWDHVLAVPDIVDRFGVPVYAHCREGPVWPHECRHLAEHGHFDAGTATAALLHQGSSLRPAADRTLWDGNTTSVAHGTVLRVGTVPVTVLHTPGHTPGGISLRVGEHLLTGDTLFPGGPGLTGWPLSDFDTIISSIRSVLFAHPDGTHVHPGHGPSTTVGTERPSLAEWVARGW